MYVIEKVTAGKFDEYKPNYDKFNWKFIRTNIDSLYHYPRYVHEQSLSELFDNLEKFLKKNPSEAVGYIKEVIENTNSKWYSEIEQVNNIYKPISDVKLC